MARPFVFRFLFLVAVAIVGIPTFAAPQTNPRFNVNLSIDYKAADETIALLEGVPVSTTMLAGLRGNLVAASTTDYIADRSGGKLEEYLDSIKYRQFIKDDIFHLEQAREDVQEIKQLLHEIIRRNFNRRVVATVEQIFPADADIDVILPVYVVALGHENVDAYVRCIVWHGDQPEFVGEGKGEQTIVINLAHAVRYGQDTDERFINLLGVVAHEVFHAAFGAYKDRSPTWQSYYQTYNQPIDHLLDLVHNEGIAYYLSLDQQGRGYLPRDWNSKTREAFASFNRNAEELLTSRRLSHRRIEEILRSANLSGYWESYGAMTGMFIAREIDLRRGRSVLIETIAQGPSMFFTEYYRLTKQDSNLPPLSSPLLPFVGLEE